MGVGTRIERMTGITISTLTNNDTTVAQRGCPRARPNSALLAAWRGTKAPATKAIMAKEIPVSDRFIRLLQIYLILWKNYFILKI